jgi:hypothetical protein
MNTTETLHELLNAAEVGDAFPPMVEKPETERQLRELMAASRIECHSKTSRFPHTRAYSRKVVM